MRRLEVLSVIARPDASRHGLRAIARFLGVLTLSISLLSACGGSASDPAQVPPPPQPHLTVTSSDLPGGVVQEPYYVHHEPCTSGGHRDCQCEPTGGPAAMECYRTVSGFQLAATGGTAPYRWITATGSALPPGLELQVSGRIDGRPTTPGEYDLTVSVSDSSTPPLAGGAPLHISITLPPPPQIASANLPSSVVNQPYSFTFAASPGPLALSWSESGALPSGILLSADGILSGTAVATGSYPITVAVEDSAHQSAMPQRFTFDVALHGFVRTSSMVGGRAFHTATLLKDGRVLLVGMQEATELYEPASATFTVSTPATFRTYHTATLLADGRVLVAGGDDLNGVTASAELYDPHSTTFTAVGSMGSARDSFSATRLGDGRVLVAGGGGVNGNLASAELFDPATGSFSATGSMGTARARHRATLLGNGKVLITGGADAGGSPLASAELYDPVSGTFTSAGSMNAQRTAHTATVLGDGRVLVTGGNDGAATVASAEIYDPAKGIFSSTASMSGARANHTATRLGDGTVLVAGGTDEGNTALIAAELYDAGAGQFTHTGSLQSARQFHTATLLLNGKVLVSGGHDPATGILTSAEVYQ